MNDEDAAIERLCPGGQIRKSDPELQRVIEAHVPPEDVAEVMRLLLTWEHPFRRTLSKRKQIEQGKEIIIKAIQRDMILEGLMQVSLHPLTRELMVMGTKKG